tara:strand:- start:1416 stop:2474 length:1059 start_codon:yes stop_codon:yes gene_type:complete
MNTINKLKVLIVNLAVISPFLNQTFDVGYNINIYLILSILSTLILPFTKTFKTIINSKDLILIILLEIFFIIFTLNQEFYIFGCYQFLILSSIFLLFSKPKSFQKSKFVNISNIYIIFVILTLFIIESNGIRLNILMSSREATAGSVLGLALIFNYGGLILFIKSRIIKSNYYLLASLFTCIMSFVFFKTKGPIVAYLISVVFFNGISFIKILISSILGTSLITLSSNTFFRANSDLSTLNRINTYLKTLELLSNSFFSFNIYEKAPYLFHNWIFESFWRLGFLNFVYLALIIITFISYKNNYYYKSTSIYILICGLFSFPLEPVIFSYTLLTLLSIYESKINNKLIRMDNN